MNVSKSFFRQTRGRETREEAVCAWGGDEDVQSHASCKVVRARLTEASEVESMEKSGCVDREWVPVEEMRLVFWSLLILVESSRPRRP